MHNKYASGISGELLSFVSLKHLLEIAGWKLMVLFEVGIGNIKI